MKLHFDRLSPLEVCAILAPNSDINGRGFLFRGNAVNVISHFLAEDLYSDKGKAHLYDGLSVSGQQKRCKYKQWSDAIVDQNNYWNIYDVISYLHLIDLSSPTHHDHLDVARES